VAQNDLARELRNKSIERGLALSRVRGNLVDVIPFDGDRISCVWRRPVYSASFSSDGAKVIVVDGKGVTIQRIDGSIVSTAGVMFPNIQPWLSPDGKQLLFQTSHLTSSPTPSGYFFTTIGSDQVEIIESEIAKSGLAAGLPSSAGWSTDNRTVVYAHDGQIIKLDLRSKHKVVLGRGTNPTWSPDNKWIAYKTEDGSARLVTPDGLTQTDLLKGRRILGYLHWSPDSEYLMYGEESHPSLLEFFTVPAGSTSRLSIYRVRDGVILPVHWFGPLGGSDIGFGWLYDYHQLCP
jgi:Tol biopolymer transport system component